VQADVLARVGDLKSDDLGEGSFGVQNVGLEANDLGTKVYLQVDFLFQEGHFLGAFERN